MTGEASGGRPLPPPAAMTGQNANAGEAVRGQAEEDAFRRPAPGASPTRHVAKLGKDYVHGAGLLRPTSFRRHARAPEEPLYRPLRVYMADPVASGYQGRIAVAHVPYEPLSEGPTGAFLTIEDNDPVRDKRPGRVNLDEPGVLLAQGRKPSAADPLFHQQMVYAVCSDVAATFTLALGRDLSWGFDGPRLKIRPHYGEDRNAYYHAPSGELRFGYFQADPRPGAGVLPGGTIFTCLSHDIVAHEMTHALLDGMRARFDEPTNPDVLAFHEAFADIVAILQHFAHPESVQNAISRTGGQLGTDTSIFSIAEQFGQATGANGPLRIALGDANDAKRIYGEAQEPHELGSVLVSAVLEALARVFERRAAPIKVLNAAVPGAGERLHPACATLLADLAMRVASQFLALCIRAIDYCPPIDIRFGEYLRALITADLDLVEDDRHGYRQELIAAFARRKIFPTDVPDISEDSLCWQPPGPLPSIPGLAFDRLQLAPDPGQTPAADEIVRQAGALADVVTDSRYRAEFGLAEGPDFDLPMIESVRILRRVGPDRQVRFGLVCEVLQTGRLKVGRSSMNVIGGSTVVMDSSGRFRFVIRKAVDNVARAQAQGAFARTSSGRALRISAASGRTWSDVHARCR
jgi:hypothetical protein